MSKLEPGTFELKRLLQSREVRLYVRLTYVFMLIGCTLMLTVLMAPRSYAAALSQSVFRAYQPSSSVVPGSPLGTNDGPVTLSSVGDQLRVRLGLTNLEKEMIAVTSVSMSDRDWTHVCALGVNDHSYCWGSNSTGAFGSGNGTSYQVPTATKTDGVMAGLTIKSLKVGYQFTCAIASNDKAYCWGAAAQGKLGNGTTTPSQYSPVAVSAGALGTKTVKKLAVGYQHVCVIASDDLVYCWGLNSQGQLGNGTNGTPNSSSVPVAVTMSGVLSGKTAKSISAGFATSCIIASDDNAYCWGFNQAGLLGNNSTVDSNVPVAVYTASGGLSGKTVLSISVGSSHACAIASDNNAYCWGYNNTGQVGSGTTGGGYSIPTPVSKSGHLSDKTVKQISASSNASCVIASDDQVYCWGTNLATGRLGNGSTVASNTPVKADNTNVMGSIGIAQVSVGYQGVCVLTVESKVHCWGGNGYGELGNGTTANSFTPVSLSTGGMANPNATIATDSLSLRAQFAPKGVESTCSAVTVGWTDITTTSGISFGSGLPDNAQAISAFGNDPTVPAISSGFSHQSIVRGTTASPHTFSNNISAITYGKTGLWDLVLRDRTARSNADYCIRLIDAPGAPANQVIGAYDKFPELTTATGSLDVRFIDGSDATISNPTIDFTEVLTTSSSQMSYGDLVSVASSRRLEIANSSSNTGWSVALAPTGGPTAKWQSGANDYLHNGTLATGKLFVNMDTITRSAVGTTPSGAACDLTGLSVGSSTSFSTTTSIVSLASASSSSGFNCRYRFGAVELGQSVPAYQTPGTYSIPMTITLMAQ